MPAFGIVMLMLLGGLFVLIFLMRSIDYKKRGSTVFFAVLLSIVVLGPVIWMVAACSQDLLPDEYYYIETLQYPSGKIVYMVYPSGIEKGSTVISDTPLTNETIVRAWRKNKWKYGIDWHNEIPRFDIIPPTDGRYNDVKDKAQRRGIKIVDVEIKEK